jgi:hypothetical protein
LLKMPLAVASSVVLSPVASGVLSSAEAAFASASRTPWPVARYCS